MPFQTSTLRRSEIWTVAGGKDYAGKPRPVVIGQENSFDATSGLPATCRLVVDKITRGPKSKVGARIGRLDDEDILRLNQAMLVFLGLAVSPRSLRQE